MIPPKGHLAMVFTDVESSAALCLEQGAASREALARHAALLRETLARHAGYEVKAMGDAFFLVFPDAAAGLAFCLEAQAALEREDGRWLGPLRVRMGLHVGEPLAWPTPATGRMDYQGAEVIKAARLQGAAHGGQILLSEEARRDLGETPALLDLGWHALRGLSGEHRVWQVGHQPFPPLRTDGATPTNLPAPVNRFVGRARELEALLEALGRGEALITLLGPGGTGKTRLASELARRALGGIVRSAWFVDLGEATTGEDVLAATAAALGVSLGLDPELQLGHAIAARGATLLVFDNFEQVVAHAGPLGRWLARAPEARALVTSRAPLRLPGERVVPLDPLPEADGVALLRDRAAIPLAESEPLAELAAALDGLPLAIELAAARMGTLRPAQILARLRDRFRLLVSRGGDRPARHATLRAAMDWSWELLSPSEQRGLARLSVFEGGFLLEAAEAVLEPLTAADPAALLDGLVARSLLRRAGDRYGFLATVQAYARERLEADRPAAERGHALYYARFGAPEALDALRRPGGTARQAALRAERENLLAAARRGEGEVAARCAVAAWEIIELYGPFSEGERLLSAALSRPDLSTGAVAALRERLGEALRLQGRLIDARVPLEQAIAARQTLGDPGGEARARGRLSRVLRDQGLLDEAEAACTAALHLARAAGDAVGEANELTELGLIARAKGQPEAAQRAYDEALRLSRALGDRRCEANVLSGLGNLAWEQGRGEDALACYEEALALNRENGNRRAEAAVRQNLGVVSRAMGRPEQSLACYREALALQRALGNRRSEGLVLGNLGNLLSETDPEAGQRAYEAALAIHREVGNRRSEAVDLGNLAVLYLERGCTAEAREALEQVIATARRYGFRRTEGVFLGKLALVCLAEGDPVGALSAGEEAERALRALGDPVQLGRAHLVIARAAGALGDRTRQAAALASAEALAAASPSAELVRDLEETRAWVAAAADGALKVG